MPVDSPVFNLDMHLTPDSQELPFSQVFIYTIGPITFLTTEEDASTFQLHQQQLGNEPTLTAIVDLQ